MNIQPYIVEFLGTPESGKTSSIKRLVPQLKQSGYKVGIVRESAEICPTQFPKGSFEANVWMSLRTYLSLLEEIHNNNDIILVDRGHLDRIFWGHKFYIENRCTLDEYISYMGSFSYKSFIPDLAICMMTNPATSISRRGGEGRIVNKNFIHDFNKKFQNFYTTISTPKVKIETTNIPLDTLVSRIKTYILSNYNNRNQTV